MRRLITILCSGTLLAIPARASDSAAPAPPVTVTVQREPVSTTVPIFRAFINAGPDKFSFLIPENIRMGGEAAPGTLKLTSLTGDTLVTLSFLDPAYKEASGGQCRRPTGIAGGALSGGKIWR